MALAWHAFPFANSPMTLQLTFLFGFLECKVPSPLPLKSQKVDGHKREDVTVACVCPSPLFDLV